MMTRFPRLLAAVALAAMSPAPAMATGGAPAVAVNTITGIPLDASWKAKLYGFAREKLLHPAWGWTHSERDYQLAAELAAKETLRIDRDVLFAAAFAHDIGAIGDFQKDGVDHAVRSVEVAQPLLREWGFPMEKWPAVRDAILGHMFYSDPAKRPEAIVLHDADTLDFLGTVGVARRLSVTGDAVSYEPGAARIREFTGKLPPRLLTRTAKRMAPARVTEMRRFLEQLDAETAGGRLP